MSEPNIDMTIKHFDSYISDTKAIFIDEPDKKGLTFGRVPFVLSTNAVDRHGEVVVPKGIDLKNFKKNPLVAWHHNATPGFFRSPTEDDAIGKIDKNTLEKTETALLGDVLFNLTENDDGVLQDPRARKIFDKLNAGILNAGSIGFLSLERSEKDRIKGQTGVTHKKSELIEFSIVLIGSNADALQKHLEKANPETRELILKEMFVNATNEQAMEFCEKVMGKDSCACDIIENGMESGGDIIEKVGRKISAASEKKLINAATNSKKTMDDINAVLATLHEDEEKPKPEKDKKDINNENNNSDDSKDPFVIVRLNESNEKDYDLVKL